MIFLIEDTNGWSFSSIKPCARPAGRIGFTLTQWRRRQPCWVSLFIKWVCVRKHPGTQRFTPSWESVRTSAPKCGLDMSRSSLDTFKSLTALYPMGILWVSYGQTPSESRHLCGWMGCHTSAPRRAPRTTGPALSPFPKSWTTPVHPLFFGDFPPKNHPAIGVRGSPILGNHHIVSWSWHVFRM